MNSTTPTPVPNPAAPENKFPWNIFFAVAGGLLLALTIFWFLIKSSINPVLLNSQTNPPPPTQLTADNYPVVAMVAKPPTGVVQIGSAAPVAPEFIQTAGCPNMAAIDLKQVCHVDPGAYVATMDVNSSAGVAECYVGPNPEVQTALVATTMEVVAGRLAPFGTPLPSGLAFKVDQPTDITVWLQPVSEGLCHL